MSYRVIQASEINEYVYCRRAWWLRRMANRQSQNVRQMAAGSAFHQQHEVTVNRAKWGKRLALILIFLSVMFIAYWLTGML